MGRVVASLLLSAALLSRALPAQSDTSATAQKTVFRGRDAAVFGAFALGSVALTRADSRISHWFRDSTQQRNRSMSRLADALTNIQETRLTLGGLLVYGIGRLSRSEPMADIGLHAAEAVFTASVASQVIRGPLGRSRPTRAGLDHPYDFHYFRGFTEFDSRAFPSIHASSAFAAATAVVAETARRNAKANWVVAPLSYAVAVAPCYARLYLGQHWASDIFMGAFMGTFAGLRVVDYSHDHPDNRVDRFFLGRHAHGLTVLPAGGGVQVTYSREF